MSIEQWMHIGSMLFINMFLVWPSFRRWRRDRQRERSMPRAWAVAPKRRSPVAMHVAMFGVAIVLAVSLAIVCISIGEALQ